MNHKELIEQEELKADGKELIEEVKSCSNCIFMDSVSACEEIAFVFEYFSRTLYISKPNEFCCSLHKKDERKSNNE